MKMYSIASKMHLIEVFEKKYLHKKLKILLQKAGTEQEHFKLFKIS